MSSSTSTYLYWFAYHIKYQCISNENKNNIANKIGYCSVEACLVVVIADNVVVVFPLVIPATVDRVVATDLLVVGMVVVPTLQISPN
jgi:hypothetical protein